MHNNLENNLATVSLKELKPLKEKTAVDLSELPPEVQLLR